MTKSTSSSPRLFIDRDISLEATKLSAPPIESPQDFAICVGTNAAGNQQGFAHHALIGMEFGEHRVGNDERIGCVKPTIQEVKYWLIEGFR